MPGTATQELRFRWDPEWRLVLVSVLLVPLFVGLGFWQLARAEEKEQIAAHWELQRQQPPADLASVDPADPNLAYRPVQLRGEYLAGRDFLLDNRVRDRRYGVEVLSPLRLEDGRLVLVNRGWLAADPARRELPAVPPAGGELLLQGYVYVQPGESYTLGQDDTSGDWPRLVQALDMPLLAAALEAELWPYTVRLSAGSATALRADWPLLNLRPEKHGAYALQWFAMAAVLALFALWRNSNLSELRRARRERKQSSE